MQSDTVLGYRRIIRSFVTWIESKGPSITILTDEDLSEFGDVLHDENPRLGSLKTVRMCVVGLNCFVPKVSINLCDSRQALRGWDNHVPSRYPLQFH